MIFSDTYQTFIPSPVMPKEDIKTSLIFVIYSDQILTKMKGDSLSFPFREELSPAIFNNPDTEYLGKMDTTHCFFVAYHDYMEIPDSMQFISLREILDHIPENLGLVLSRAIHLNGWIQKTKFCGFCGSPSEKHPSEVARICPNCGNVMYPKISPAIIIAITKGNKILLAHNKNFKTGRYSTLAGFVEPGETIEACAAREVFEETGIHIKNISYFGSQPWPFPDSLMIGLTAEYDGGDIRVDGIEIEDAAFFSPEEFPDIPPMSTMAGRLIHWFVENSKR